MSKSIIVRLSLTAIICAGVFKISAAHIIEVATRYGNSFDNAIVYPVCIDALIIISALYLSAGKGISKATRFYATMGRYFGFGATIFCNAAASNWSSTMACIINLIPAISLIIGIELLVHGSKAGNAATQRRNSRSTRKAL